MVCGLPNTMIDLRGLTVDICEWNVFVASKWTAWMPSRLRAIIRECGGDIGETYGMPVEEIDSDM